MDSIGRFEPPISTPDSPSLLIIRRNLPALLGIVAVAHVPVYLISLLTGGTELTRDVIRAALSEGSVAPAAAAAFLRIATELALVFKILCCAFITEQALTKNAGAFPDAIRHGLAKIGIAIVALLPLFLAQILNFGVEMLLTEPYNGLVLLTIIPSLLLAVFQILMTVAVSLRGLQGGAAYAYCWDLAQGNWKRILSTYLVTMIAMLAAACSLYLPIVLLLHSSGGVFESFGGIIVDILYVWVIVEMTRLFLDIERIKTKTPAGISGGDAAPSIELE